MDPHSQAAQQYPQYQNYPQQQPHQPQPQQPMWAPAQQPQHQHQQPPPNNPDEVRTLWIGDLQYWMDENYIASCFPQTGEVTSIKVIRNKLTQQSEGYGFVEFANHAAADTVLQSYNATPMPNSEQSFKLNWAYYGAGEKRDDSNSDHTLFVGDLAADVTDLVLQEIFRARYPSVKGAKVVIDRATGRTKGYGFVRFSDETEQLRAIQEMNGVLCSTRPMRVGPAANKKNSNGPDSYQSSQATQGDGDPNNTTIFVGNLDANVIPEEHLRHIFSPYGELVHVKIVAGKRCGFVQFVNRSSAEEALRILNGSQVAGQSLRLSWGRNSSNKQDLAAGAVQPQWNAAAAAGYYGYPPQGHNMYGYPPQDPNMYYQGYAGYGNYPMPQQQQPVNQQQ